MHRRRSSARQFAWVAEHSAFWMAVALLALWRCHTWGKHEGRASAWAHAGQQRCLQKAQRFRQNPALWHIDAYRSGWGPEFIDASVFGMRACKTEAILIVGAHGAPLLVSAPCSHPLCWCLLGFGLVGGLGMQVDTAANLSKIVPPSRGVRCFEVLGGRFVSMHVPWQPRYMRGGAEEVTPLFCRRPNGNASQGLRCFRMMWGSQRCCLVCG